MKSLGQIAFEGYYSHSKLGDSWIGPCVQQDKWEAAAQAVIAAVGSPAAKPKTTHVLTLDSCLVCPYHRIYQYLKDEESKEMHCVHRGVNGQIIGPANEYTPIPEFCPLPLKESR